MNNYLIEILLFIESIYLGHSEYYDDKTKIT